MDNVVPLPPSGNPTLKHLTEALDLAEAERSAWLKFRLRQRAFRKSRSLADEVKLLEARNAWDRAFRQIEHQEVAA